MPGSRSLCIFILLLLSRLVASPLAHGQTFEKQIVKQIESSFIDQLSIMNHEGDIEIVTGDTDVLRFEVLLQISGIDDSVAQTILDKAVIPFDEEANRMVVSSPKLDDPVLNTPIQHGRMTVNYRIEVPADTYISLTTARGNIYVETLDNDLFIHLTDGRLSLGDINGKLSLQLIRSEGSISQINNGEFNLMNSELEMEDANRLSLDLKHAKIISGTLQNLILTSSNSDIHAIAVNNFSYEGKKDSITIEAVDSMDCKSSGSVIHIHELHHQGHFYSRYGDLQIDEIFPTLSNLLIESAYGNVTLNFQPGTPYAIDARLKHATISYSVTKIIENIKKKNRYLFKAFQGKANVPVIINLHYGKLILN